MRESEWSSNHALRHYPELIPYYLYWIVIGILWDLWNDFYSLFGFVSTLLCDLHLVGLTGDAFFILDDVKSTYVGIWEMNCNWQDRDYTENSIERSILKDIDSLSLFNESLNRQSNTLYEKVCFGILVSWHVVYTFWFFLK